MTSGANFDFKSDIVVVVVVLWNTYGDCDNIAVMKGHSGAVMDLHFNTDGRSVFACCAHL